MQGCTSQIDSGTFRYITTIEDRRVQIADTVAGLAIGFSHFGQIHEIEAIGISVPYHSPSGWEG